MSMYQRERLEALDQTARGLVLSQSPSDRNTWFDPVSRYPGLTSLTEVGAAIRAGQRCAWFRTRI
jgi:hypothetical protein